MSLPFCLRQLAAASLTAWASPPPGASQLMGKSKVLVKVNPEGKYVVDLGECGAEAQMEARVAGALCWAECLV